MFPFVIYYIDVHAHRYYNLFILYIISIVRFIFYRIYGVRAPVIDDVVAFCRYSS